MIPTAARAVERLFGGALLPAAGALRVAALASLGIVLVLAVAGILRAVAARRYGLETGSFVRCLRCAKPVADPALGACPEGHPVRFPAGAAAREMRRQAAGPRRDWLSPASAAGCAAVAFLALVSARAFRIADPGAPPLAAIAGAAGFLFCAGALLAALRAVAPGVHGVFGRLLACGAAAAAVAPALFFLVLTRAADPPGPRTLGSLWRTPSALYVSDGGKARREAPPGEPLEADVVSVASPLLGSSWEGLARLRSGGQEFPWRGRSGASARGFAGAPRLMAALGFSVSRSWRPVTAPLNERIWIVRGPGGIAFTTAAERDEGKAPDLGR
ncbi:MAG: hypothetical protein M3S32_11355 [Acidobacteriota bacterium]|nr:hypothetical protein [Acidobacteriota bacterium]